MRIFIATTWYTTPIHKACYDNDVDGLRALVEILPKPEVETQLGQRDHHGWTALHVAVLMSNIEIVIFICSFCSGVIDIPGRNEFET
jgi:ankyrin repeat protein